MIYHIFREAPKSRNVEIIKFLEEYKQFWATCLFSGGAPSGVLCYMPVFWGSPVWREEGGRPSRGFETKEIIRFCYIGQGSMLNHTEMKARGHHQNQSYTAMGPLTHMETKPQGHRATKPQGHQTTKLQTYQGPRHVWLSGVCGS